MTSISFDKWLNILYLQSGNRFILYILKKITKTIILFNSLVLQWIILIFLPILLHAKYLNIF